MSVQGYGSRNLKEVKTIDVTDEKGFGTTFKCARLNVCPFCGLREAEWKGEKF